MESGKMVQVVEAAGVPIMPSADDLEEKKREWTRIVLSDFVALREGGGCGAAHLLRLDVKRSGFTLAELGFRECMVRALEVEVYQKAILRAVAEAFAACACPDLNGAIVHTCARLKGIGLLLRKGRLSARRVGPYPGWLARRLEEINHGLLQLLIKQTIKSPPSFDDIQRMYALADMSRGKLRSVDVETILAFERIAHLAAAKKLLERMREKPRMGLARKIRRHMKRGCISYYGAGITPLELFSLETQAVLAAINVIQSQKITDMSRESFCAAMEQCGRRLAAMSREALKNA